MRQSGLPFLLIPQAKVYSKWYANEWEKWFWLPEAWEMRQDEDSLQLVASTEPNRNGGIVGRGDSLERRVK
jgi:hypothetical protein